MNNILIVLCAGMGTRLMPITNECPKCMTSIGNDTIIDHIIKTFSKYISLEDMYLGGGYMFEYLNDHINNKFSKCNLINNQKYNTTNNMYTCKIILEHILKKKVNFDNVIIINGDIYIDPLIAEYIININIDNDNIIAVNKSTYDEESMKISVNNDIVTSISKSITKDDAFGRSIDLYKFSKTNIIKYYDILVKLCEEDCNKWNELAIDYAIKNNILTFKPLDILNRFWYEVDTIEDLINANNGYILKNIYPLIVSKNKIFDLDGTIYKGNELIKNVNSILLSFFDKFKYNETDVYFITNNTSKTHNDYNTKLKNMINISDNIIDRILTPLDCINTYLIENNINKFLYIGTDETYQYLKNNKLNCIDYRANLDDIINIDIIILANDTEINYQKLELICMLIQKYSKSYIITNIDSKRPVEYGFLPDTNLFTKIITETTGITPLYILGKTDINIKKTIENKFNIDNNQSVVFGDNLNTDYIMSKNIGADFICVGSGVTSFIDHQLTCVKQKTSIKYIDSLSILYGYVESYRKYQLDVKKFIDTINKFLNKNVKLFLICGTALGAFRNNGIYYWDTDIDVGICYDDLDYFFEILNEMPEYYVGSYMYCNEPNIYENRHIKKSDDDFYKKYNYYLYNINSHVTVFELNVYVEYRKEDIADKYKPIRWEKYHNENHDKYITLSQTGFKYEKNMAQSIPTTEAFPLTTIDFYNTKMPVFKNIKKYLKSLYGENCLTHMPSVNNNRKITDKQYSIYSYDTIPIN